MMDKLIYCLSEYSLWEIAKGNLPEAINFVVETNYNRHQGELPVYVREEVTTICDEESDYFHRSFFYALRDNCSQKIIGTIRVLQWDKNMMLPIQKKYAVDIEKLVTKEKSVVDAVWYIGRFAINSKVSNISILKTLLVNGFHAAYSCENSILLAELDKKLFDKLKLLNICFSQVGDSQLDMGSETVPAYILSRDLSLFQEKNKHLCYV